MSRYRRVAQPILNPPGLHKPIPISPEVLWEKRMELLAQERELLAEYFAAKNAKDADSVLAALDQIDEEIALNAHAQGLPVNRMPRLMRPEREAGARPVFGKGKVAA